MSEESKQVLRSGQCARIIRCISEMHHVSLEEATDIYYCSDTSALIEEGVADLHCRSDKYLAEEVWREHCEKEATRRIAASIKQSLAEVKKAEAEGRTIGIPAEELLAELDK